MAATDAQLVYPEGGAGSEEDTPVFAKSHQGSGGCGKKRLAAGLLAVALLVGVAALAMGQQKDVAGRTEALAVLGAAEEQNATEGNPTNSTTNKGTTKQHDELAEQTQTSLVDARQAVRESVLKLKAKGQSVDEIKAAGYTRRNLGCNQQEKPLKRCLKQLKEGFSPEELQELLGLETDDELLMLTTFGLKAKTDGWKKGDKVLMCWRPGDEGDENKGCSFRRIRKVSDEVVQLRHIEVDPSTGKGAQKDHHFTVFGLEEWK